MHSMVTVCHHAANGELQHFLADLHGNTATKENFELDAQSFEKYSLEMRVS